MRQALLAKLVFLLASSVVGMQAQSALDVAVGAKFPLTKATADRGDIVTAGSVMVLKKDGMIMYPVGSSSKSSLLYKDGRIQPSTSMKVMTFSVMGHAASNTGHRDFVSGEKFWLIDVQTQQDGVTLQLLSDPYNDVRYITSLKFPFPKGQPPAPEVLTAQIAQVMTPEGGAPEAAAPAPGPRQPVAPVAPVAPMAAIAPPPPPPDAAPVNLQKGQTKESVVAAMGPPVRVVKMGVKEIDYYKDMKVTFTNNKITNIE